ncbi:MAG: GNAT family N-acetyltransferase [Chthonomonadaceae bacterium]|nr:GNAT family N-acetyltransferase [Chthonomonadaceae bacterium]
MAHGWEGELVRLVPLDKDRHFDNCVKWVNDPDVTEWLLIGDFPLSRLSQSDWFEKAARATDTNVMFAIETLDGRHIGNSGVHQIDLRNGTCITGSMIGEKEVWGKGYGTDASRIRAHYCFHVLGLRVLYSGYLEGNERSRRMSEKNGYTECGRMPKKYWKRGQFRDEVLMFLDRETWSRLNLESQV